MVTSRSSELDHVLGLEMGADDYVTKPFSILTLMSRVKAILRRVSALLDRTPDSEQKLLDFDELWLDPSSRVVRKNQETVELTAREFDLLKFMISKGI